MALIAQLGEHCTGIAEVVGSNPAQSLKIFPGLCSSSVTAAFALITDKEDKRSGLKQDLDNGGIRMIDFDIMLKALKLS